jgi:hypothetical protein
MIQFLADNIEQLDLALEQISMGDRNFDRFAIMLIDNVVELTLHKFAQQELVKYRMNKSVFRTHDQEKISEKDIKDALGHYFEGKVKFAFKCGLIDQSTQDSILNLHSYRNTAYHKGLRHERILHSLAVFYFRNTCALLKAYKPFFWSWSGSDNISERAMKYLGNPPSTNQDKFVSAYEKLDELAASMQENLISDLAEDAKSTIETSNQEIDFLNEGDRDWAIVFAQASAFQRTENAEIVAIGNGYNENSEDDFLDWLIQNHPWKVKRDPIPGWRSRCNSIAKETDYDKALKKYCDFMKQTDELRVTLTEVVDEINHYIGLEAEISRGK